jgi:hypothetical protein
MPRPYHNLRNGSKFERTVSEKFIKAKNEFVMAVDSQSPFIPMHICDALSEIIGVANKVWSELATEPPFTSDWYGKGSENYQDLCRRTEQVSDFIRARLESLAIIPAQNTV